MRRSTAHLTYRFVLFVLVGFVVTACGGGGPAGPDSQDTLEPTANISISGNLSVDRIIIPAGVTVTITGPTTIQVDGEVQILGTLTGNCHALTIIGSGAGTIAGTIANHCTSGGAVGGNLEFTVDGPLSWTGAIRSAGNILVRNTPDIDAADLDGLFQSPPRGAPSQQAGPGDDCTIEGAELFGPVADPAPAAQGQDGQDAPDVDVICSGDAVLDDSDFDVGAEGQDGGPPAAAAGGPAGVSQNGGDGGDGPDFDFWTPGDLTINPEQSSTLRLARGGDGTNSTVTATVPGQSATATGGDGGNGGGMRIGAGGTITIAARLTIVTGGGGHGGNASATGAKGNDGATAASQPGGNATAIAGNGGHTTLGRLRASGVVGVTNIEVDDGGNYGDGGNGGDATAVAGQGGNGGAFDINGAIGGNMIASGGDGGDVRTQGLSGAYVGDAGNGGDITVGGAGGGGAPSAQLAALHLNVPPLLAPSMGGDGLDKCNPPAKGGDGGPGGSVLKNGAFDSQPGTAGDRGPSNDGVDGIIRVLNDTGVGGDGGDGNPVGAGGGEGSDTGLGIAYVRVDGNPIFEPGDPGSPCPVPNTPPTLTSGSATTPKNTAVVVTLVYSDPQNDAPNPASATVNNINPPGSGTVTNFQAVGTTGLRFTFTPTTGFVGTVTFQVSVNDARGALSNVVTVTVNVTDTGALRDMRLEYGTPFASGGTYTRTVTDIASLLGVGTMQYGPTGPGGFFFSSVDPPGIRHGMNGNASNAINYNFQSLLITGDPTADVEQVRVCLVNTANVSTTNPATLVFFGAAAAPPAQGHGAPADGPAQAVPNTVAITGNGCTQFINTMDAVRMELRLGVIGVGTAVLDVLRLEVKVRTTINPALPG